MVTAGNASQQNDAAAACLVVAEDKLEELGLEPIAWFHSWAAAGVDPSRMGYGPVPATERLFSRNGLSMANMDLIELNEAFAPQVLACLKGWGWSDDDTRHEILNVNGSGISLGHPIGATGGRILANLTREMQRRDVRKYGLETMCIGGGQGIAAVFERRGMTENATTSPKSAARCRRSAPSFRASTGARKDRERAYPGEFVDALTKAGFLAALIPEEFGGSGLKLDAAAVIMEEIQSSGCNGASAHAQMYIMNTLLRYGSPEQKAAYLPGIADGSLRLQAFGVSEPTSGTDTLSCALSPSGTAIIT